MTKQSVIIRLRILIRQTRKTLLLLEAELQRIIDDKEKN